MKKKKERKKKNLKNPRNQTPCHSLFSAGIICGPHRGSFAVRDHLRSNLGIISGPGIICGRGSFAALYSTQSAQFTCYFLFPPLFELILTAEVFLELQEVLKFEKLAI